MNQLNINPLQNGDDEFIAHILEGAGWASQYVESQLKYIQSLENKEDSEVWVASLNNEVVGFLTVQHHKWNRLSFVHGLVVSIGHQRHGIGGRLMKHVENTTRTRGNRGVFLDTPVNNMVARQFYKAVGYAESYFMPEYYEPGLDGVTLLKLFKKEQ
jgi:ribosomal protein S18 acetylase RimI-like enzyme